LRDKSENVWQKRIIDFFLQFDVRDLKADIRPVEHYVRNILTNLIYFRLI